MDAGEERLGRFLVRGQLGAGGSGVVYAIDYDGGRRAALKVLRQERAGSERAARRFLDEAERMARLAHPALVPLLESGYLPDGRPYLVMPLLDGETAAARVARGPLPLSSALRIFDQIAGGLSAVHEAGLVHRDVKPENVILVGGSDTRESTRAVLLDFGIAREIASGPSTATIAGLVSGSAAYMAPERFFGTPASVRSDVYELAVLLYVLLTGRLPWNAEADASERLAPPDPRSFRPEIPAALAVLLLGALSTRPEKRPGSVAELARALANASASAGDARDGRRTADIPVAPPPPALRDVRTSEMPSMPRATPTDLAGVIGPGAVAPPPRGRARVVGLALLSVVVVAGLALARGLRRPVPPDVPVTASSPPAAASSPEPRAAAPSASTSSEPPVVAPSVTPAPAVSVSTIVVRTRAGAPRTTSTAPANVAPSTTRRREDWYEDRK